MSQCSPSRKQNMRVLAEEEKQGKCGYCNHFYTKAGDSDNYCTKEVNWKVIGKKWEHFCSHFGNKKNKEKNIISIAEEIINKS